MALRGGGLLAIWTDVDPADEAEVNDWYLCEHLAERVGLPGFLRGRRYVATDGRTPVGYAALYETETPEVLQSPAYRERLDHPTPRTVRGLQRFRNTNRSVCRVAATVGRGVGGALATLWLSPAEGEAEALRAWLCGTALPGLLAEAGVVGAHLCLTDPALTRVETTESRIREGKDAMSDWVALVEALDDAALALACARRLGAEALSRQGALPGSRLRRYRLLHQLDHGEALGATG